MKFIAVIAPPFFIFPCIVLKNSAITKLVLTCTEFVDTYITQNDKTFCVFFIVSSSLYITVLSMLMATIQARLFFNTKDRELFSGNQKLIHQCFYVIHLLCFLQMMSLMALM